MTTATPRGQGGGRGTVHGDLSQMAQPQRLNGLLYYGVLLVAAGIDIATFYQVLALVMKNVPDEVVWLGVVGFTVTALSLAHTMGVRVRDRIDEGGRAFSSASAWLLFVIWLFVGVTAFIVRFVAAEPSTTGGTSIVVDGEQISAPVVNSDNPLLAALLFLALYLATGTVAAIAGYLRHNTAAKQYAVTLRTRASAAKVAASSAADLALARQTKVALEEERRRRAEGWVKAQEEWQAIARRLKQEARLRLASAAQNPSTTDAYFVPPTSTGLPVSGAPVSGMPISGMPSWHAHIKRHGGRPSGRAATARGRAGVPDRRPVRASVGLPRTRGRPGSACRDRPAGTVATQCEFGCAAPIGGQRQRRRPGPLGRWTMTRRVGLAVAAMVAVLPLLAACSDNTFAAGSVDLACPTQPGGPVTIAVGARSNSPAPVLPPAIVDLMGEAAKQSKTISLVRVDGSPTVAFQGTFRTDAANDVARNSELDTFLEADAGPRRQARTEDTRGRHTRSYQ